MARGPRKQLRVQAPGPKANSTHLKPPQVQALEPETKSSTFKTSVKPRSLKSLQVQPSRGLWTEELMHTAIQCIKAGERSIRNAYKYYSIPTSSIRDWMSGKTKTKRHGHDPYLTQVEESELKEWCFKMQDMAFSVTLAILKNSVREIVQRIPRKHPFKDDLLGHKWWQCFKSRHPDVVLRLGDSLEMKRCVGLNRISCSWFYTGLSTIVLSHGFEASHIWNMDETGVHATGRNGTLKVIAKKGSKNVNVQGGDSREWLTIAVCVNAIGASIPPYFIFKGKYLMKDYVELCGPGAVMNVQENGWITTNIFCDWLEHFKENVPGGVSKQNKHLLIYDGHSSHVSGRALDTCIRMGIDIMSIPSHTSHKMQPLDVSCFKPFNP
jgi:hypothetical protein